MSSRFIMPFADVGSGIKPSSGAKLFFFELDGVTPKNTFSDQLSTPTPNTNPVISDSNGVFGDIYIDGTYKVTLQNKNGTQIFGGVIVGDPTSDLINDLSQAYEFATVAAMTGSAIVFPVSKKLHVIDVNNTYSVTSGSSPNPVNPSLTAGLYAKINYSESITQVQLGLTTGDTNDATANLSILNAVRDELIDNNVTLVIDSSKGSDIAISDGFQFVKDTLNASNEAVQSLKIHSLYGGGFLRFGDLTGAVFTDVLTVGDRAEFCRDISITGGVALRHSSATNSNGKKSNRRGMNTSALNLGNCHHFKAEILCAYAEYGIYGKSIFAGNGHVDFEWCHKGWSLKPSRPDSAGSACTSLYFQSNFDFTIHPFDIDVVVYSKFHGFAEAVRQSYEHYESDETAIFLRDEGLGSVSFDFGIEAFEGMYRYNKTTPSYTDMKLRIELGAATEDHFRRDGVRISNIPYADQACFSVIPAGTFDLKDTQLSGSTVVTSTGDTALFHKPDINTKINITGGIIEPGSNYLVYTTGSEWTSVTSNSARFAKNLLYPLGSETYFAIGNGMYIVDLGSVAIQVDGTFTAAAPAGFGRVISVDAYVIRASHNTDNNITLVSKSANSWDFITGLTTGFSANVSITCMING